MDAIINSVELQVTSPDGEVYRYQSEIEIAQVLDDDKGIQCKQVCIGDVIIWLTQEQVEELQSSLEFY